MSHPLPRLSKPAALWHFSRFVWQRFQDIQLLHIAGSLTFTSLLALVPMLTVVLAVLTQLPAFRPLAAVLTNFINATIVPSSADAVIDYLNRFKEQAAGLTAVGTGVMTVTSLLLIQTIDSTFNRIWRIRNPRVWWVRLPVYVALLLFGPLLAGLSLSATAYLFNPTFLDYYLSPLSGSLKTFGLTEMLPRFLFDSILLWLLYLIVPNCYVPPRHALYGALATALLLEAAKWGFGHYLAHFNSYQLIYGAFAILPVFLVWLHVLWMIVLSGALFTACLSYWHGGAFLRRSSPQALFDDITAVLLQLYRAGQHGRTLRDTDFRRHIAIGYDELANLLDILAENGYISDKKQRGWYLKRSAHSINLADIFALFVYNPANQPDTADARSIGRLMQPGLAAMNISLADWADSLPPDTPPKQPEKNTP